MRLRLLILIVTLAYAQPLMAQQDTTGNSAPPADPSKRNILAVNVAYGAAISYNGSVETDLAALLVRWTHTTNGRVLGGQPAWGVELIPLITVDQQPRAYGAGWHLIYEQRYRTQAAVRPVLSLGAGMIFTDKKVPIGETHYNFSLLVGAGVEIDLSPRTALNLGYRLRHVSNANTGVRNPGINAHTLLVGISRSF